MIHLALQTEFSFKKCFGHLEKIVEHEVALGKSHIGIADVGNTFGHVKFSKLCKKHGIKPIFGVRLNVIDPESKQRTCHSPHVFIAKNNAGLKEIYDMTKRAYELFYYIPRIPHAETSDNVIVLAPYRAGFMMDVRRSKHVAIIENNFILPSDRKVYELMAGRTRRGTEYFYNFEQKVTPQHIIDDDEFLMNYIEAKPIIRTYDIAKTIDAELQSAPMVSFPGKVTVEMKCKVGARRRKIDLTNPAYKERYEYELDLIHSKGYDDYFLITADLIMEAKQTMLVGPSRGSSAGSLVCYLMGITEIDPLEYDLLFERFIDINRFDLPDIDIDFPDVKRKEIIKYLSDKYGADKVMTLANISTFQPKSAIGEFAAGLGIPKYETEAVKGAIIERSSGDARAAMCIADTFDTTTPGKEFIKEYPTMRLVSDIEGHASHSGKHAAGIIVSTEAITNYCGIDSRAEVCMIDKKDAESIGLLKIDCLGLRTLSILEEAAKLSGMTHREVYNIPLDDPAVFKIFNDMRLSGVFQFEGYALQSLTRQMGVHHFDDIIAITSLARPGALNSGGASRYVKRHTGEESYSFINADHEEITKDTHGITVYQEQMMQISREVGKLSWEDTSELRKAASRSLGDEFFSKYTNKFLDGAINQSGLTLEQAEDIWNDISHSGSWSFNKSHAVAYGLISYWTAWFKANEPLNFAVAALNNATDSDHAIKLLRDITDNDGLEYIPVIPEVSGIGWTVYDGKLLGGLTNIRSVGVKRAKEIIRARKGQGTIGPAMFKLLSEEPSTDFDILFPARHYWGKLYNDPLSYGLKSKPQQIKEIDDEGIYTFIGKLVDRNLRDLNEYVFLVKRNGKIIEEDHLYLNFTVEDDSDSIICTIDRWKFEGLGGREIAEQGRVGSSWYLIQGTIKGGWRKINVTNICNLDDTLGDLT